ncbi:high salinity-induced biofilm formation responseregulaton Rre8 [Synechocystis salina]|uniref:Diguanylate cyclase n=1 Tax=Synechocystis salina LEGE 00031 TaxID=1828736 RepID=A0ABR9VW67_9SYNC|nr:diguanylate cyclase [Synechocystis salina LEGE 00041]MBE9254663.1 diguanylate cyclase [Synechocystis salina LEGE 00031]
MTFCQRRLQILLIEDQQCQVELLKILLESQSFFAVQLQVARTLAQGINRLQSGIFDTVLLDLFLPDGQGIPALTTIQKFAPHIPIIVLTTATDLNMGLAALQKGAEDYLVKEYLRESQIAKAIIYGLERKKTKRQLQTQIERERLMGRILEEIRQSLDLSVVLQTTVDEVRKFLQVDQVVIYRCYSPTTSRILVAAPSSSLLTSGDRRHSPQRGPDSNGEPTEPIPCQTINSLHPLPIAPITLGPRAKDGVLIVPIWQKKPHQEDRLWGQLVVRVGDQQRSWLPWEIEFLCHLSSQVAIAIQQSALFAQVHYLANMDGLTGIGNRRYLDHFLEQQWQKLAKSHQYLSLVLCDIDFFKQYNDTYGHLQGDECLKQVAKLMERVIRRGTDLVARYGGEEFALVLPQTNHQGCQVLVAHLQTIFKQAQIPHRGSIIQPHLTLSIGSTTMVPSPNMVPTELIDQADRALFKAKKAGRNRHFSFAD